MRTGPQCGGVIINSGPMASETLSQVPYALDRRKELAGQPYFQILLIGVSAYRHLLGGCAESRGANALRLGQLNTPTATAVKLYEWLLRADHEKRLPYPIGTATLLLAPSPTESPYVSSVLSPEKWASPTRAGIEQAIRRFQGDILACEHEAARKDGSNPPGLGLYYFGGHGVDGGRDDPIILTEDVLAPNEAQSGANAIAQAEITTLLTQYSAEDGAGKTSAQRTQLFIICDCCREATAKAAPEAIEPDLFFDVHEAPPEPRDHRVLWATAPRLAATGLARLLDQFASHGQPLTALGHLLITCLEWADEENLDQRNTLPLRLSTSRLAEHIADSWRELATILEELGGKLDGKPESKSSGPAFSMYFGRSQPEARIRLRCSPEDLYHKLHVSIRRDQFERRIPAPWTKHPESITLVPHLFDVEFGTAEALPALTRRIPVRLAVRDTVWEFRRDQLEICSS